MKIKLSILFVLCSIGFSIAQITSRVIVDGKINAPIGDDVEGVVIYNRSTDKGTVTDNEGHFHMRIGINDKIEIEAMQYQNFVVLVDKGVINSKKLNVFLNESVNLLDEVIVTPYDLLGNVSVDVKKVAVSIGGIDEVARLTASRINDANYADWKPDELSEVKNNAYLTNRTVHELNFVNLFKAVFQSKNKKKDKKDIADIDVKVRKMYDDQFFKTNLALEMDQINDFIFFAENNGLDKTYLEGGKELELIQFLVSQSKLYKDRR
ncbi:carboxypeptidase-like regulatory domain-containing protein [Aquimarina sp. RZ0]|uniref:carboxypeptidase-like regulatory domain-containing protein n=1 Tax=Aquimarina sp. RZ0 TaxID=2607730 RepID=UPI0011F1EB62|nr:carboxypeptidase-like regulatory domain-containing protein [Aquimarina sp. RZ0]KAA1247143.1 hypothetical protein F0000_04340 [Aquimarina sp. RZ0]